MIANVYSHGKHTRLNITVEDLEELIMRCGWTVLNDLEGITEEARCKVNELDRRGYVESNGSGIEWWKARVLSAEPCLTPDL